jgi:regulatory protein
MPSTPSKKQESAETSALRLLGRRDYSRSELRRKLTGKGFSNEEAEGVLSQFEDRGLLNDRRLAQRLADSYSREKLWGPQKLLQKLVQRGIPGEMARQVLNREEDGGRTRERLRVVLRNKMKGQDPLSLSARERKRLANYLHQRGYAWDDIWEAMQETGGLLEE